MLVIAFIAAITTPGLVMITRQNSADREQPYRLLKAQLRDAHSVIEDVSAFQTWFETTFAFRDELIEARALVRVKGLGVSTSDLVVIGHDDWLFYAGEESVESYRHLRPFSPSELVEWEHVLDEWVARCRAVGAPLIVMIPPDKPTVYPELMPAWANIVENRPSRLDQLATVMAQRTDLDFIDLRPVFSKMRQRSRLPLYYRTDTHWNLLGSYVAARELAAVLAKRFPAVAVPPPVTNASVIPVHGGDLARFLGLAWLDDEDVRFAEPVPLLATIQSSGDFATRDVHIETTISSSRPNAAIPRGLIFRDSFSSALITHMAEHFGSARYIWTTLVDPEQLQAFEPNVVVVEFVERTLMRPPNTYLRPR